MHIAEVQPNSGPATGYIVTVIGGKFKNYTEGLRCRFADQIVPAVYVSERLSVHLTLNLDLGEKYNE